ncbi:hypothetical protein [Aeromicrobium sp.]|uniref:hypothetical protein n=1 Tax=Aeromicrobium sp. TaxID=1871063 RepID=UPI0030C59F91
MATSKPAGARHSPLVVVSVAAACVVAVRLLLLPSHTGGDEAGFLMVGTGWHDGASLYGNYWVDRPPLLIWITELAGNVTALRLLGCLASVTTVLGVAWAAFLARGVGAASWAAGAAALFLSAQWLGVARVNGEMLAAPFVAWSIALTLYAVMHATTWRIPAALGAGVLAVAALFVKQSVVEAFVFALALSLAVAFDRPESRRVVLRVLAWGALGGAAAGALMLLLADTRGTSPADLFDAVVTFRAEAGEVIRTSASDATPLRLVIMIATWLVSGLGAATVLAVWQGARSREPVLLAATAMLLCGLVFALFGGSYWAHYLIQLIPAASLTVGLLADRVPHRVLRRLAVATVAVTVANLGWAIGFQPDDNEQQHAVGTWLRDARQPADTAVVTYGQPNILLEARMPSPYRYLWSLPVRTRDSQLRDLSMVLASPRRPTWVVDWSGLASWGVEPQRAWNVLESDYRQVASICGHPVWLLADDPRTLPAAPEACP